MSLYRSWSLPGIAIVLAAAVATREDVLGPQRLAAEAFAGPVPATVERIVDGDTIEVRARIWLGQSLTVKVRIDGVDAPEMEARCPEEKRMALAARDYLVRRLMGAGVQLSRVVYDKYGGRVRADVADAESDIALGVWPKVWSVPTTGSGGSLGARLNAG